MTKNHYMQITTDCDTNRQGCSKIDASNCIWLMLRGRLATIQIQPLRGKVSIHFRASRRLFDDLLKYSQDDEVVSVAELMTTNMERG